MLVSLLPSWVESDPLRSRAVDALGLQAVSDNLADRLLPGLSVLTTRARYFTFLCWARRYVGSMIDEREIHRLEVALMLSEAVRTKMDPSHAACSYVGSRNAKNLELSAVPADPRVAYKFPVWRSYRAAMVSLGLVTPDAGSRLTENGELAAKYFSTAIGKAIKPTEKPLPESACLSQITPDERKLMRDLIGLSKRGNVNSESTNPRDRRTSFAREMAVRFGDKRLTPGVVLPMYENTRRTAASEPSRTLHCAVVWEYLTVGLNGLFISWARAIESGLDDQWRRHVAKALKSGVKEPTLRTIKILDPTNDEYLQSWISALRHSLDLRDRLIQDQEFMSASQFELANSLLARSGPKHIESWLMDLLSVHEAIKGDDAWIRIRSNGSLYIDHEREQSWKLPDRVGPHAYRLEAFDSLVRDLGGY